MSAPPGDHLSADLNPAQRQAVLHGEGPLLVVAGPGSGKTTVLTRRAARLVALGAEPRAILLITFTTAARDEMRRRLAALLPTGSQADVSTFHGLCYRLVRAHHPERVRALLDGSGQRRLVGGLLLQLARERRRQGAVPPDADAAALDQALTDLSRLRNAGLRATDPGAPTPQGLRRDDLAALAAAYAAVKERRLFYVALTRAKDEAVCTWVGEASRFLVEAGLAATGAAAKGGGGTASRAHPSSRGRAAEGAGLAAGAPGTQRTPDATPTVLGLSRCRALAAFCACGPRAQGGHRFRPGERACPRCGAARQRCAQPVAQDGLCAHHLRRGPAEAVGGALVSEEHAPPR